MIIVEGCDGSGKTTLCNKLKSDGVVKEVILSPERTRGNIPLLEQSHRYVMQYGPNHNVCVDRFLWSERVYGPILRDSCKIPAKDYLDILSDLMMFHCPIIFCLPSKASDLRINGEKQMPGVKENIEKIFDRYVDYYKNTCDVYRQVFRYRLNDPGSYDQLYKKLKGEEKW